MYRTRWIASVWRTVPVEHTQFTFIHALTIHLRASSPLKRRLTHTSPTPPFGADVRASAHTNPPRALIASWPPCPARTPCDGEMVPSEGEPRTCDANEGAKQQVKPKMSEIRKARTCDVDGGADGYEDENQSVDGRCGVLVADGYHSVLMVRSWR